MARRLGYADAARLLGGGESPLINALDKATGGLMLGLSIAIPGVLSWFDAKAEFIRLSHELIRGVSERRSGLSRYDRTQRFEAAHTVIVVVAFFEAIEAAALPFQFAELELTPAEQLTIATGTAMTDPLRDLFAATPPVPLAHVGQDSMLRALENFYDDMCEDVRDFIRGLAVTDLMSAGAQRRFLGQLDSCVDPAIRRYSELLRQLAVEFPEVGFWVNLGEHAATRTEVRALGTGLSRLEEALARSSAGHAPDTRRRGLASAYRAELDLPVVSGGEVPDGLRVPTLGAAYLAPRFRVGDLFGSEKPNDEGWWAGREVRDDLDEFLVGHLTSSVALDAPLLVLGQPGSGKSVLTKVLAARLPAADFLPVRVPLREVHAAADLQEQVEQAIRKATGERLEWPTLAASAGDALPVVLLDGFDELLQAVGVSHTDYLQKVAEFQRREAVQGRPIAVVVTSRTAVADRAYAPSGTVVLRLEPFDKPRIEAWLRIWNDANAAPFKAAGVAPLSAEVVLAQRALAEQPLLLLMLAIYDADGNALQKLGAGIGQYELYERLLTTFARREIQKHRQGLSDAALAHAVEEELRTLSVVGFAMHNRGTLWITEEQLEADLPALFGIPRAPAAGTDMRVPLRAAELMIGRFFFVHRAGATTGTDDRRETYEFLHATFGEFLVARLTCQVLHDMAAREQVTMTSLAAAPVDDDLLHALLSYSPLTFSTAIPGFIEERLAMGGQDEVARLTTRLYKAAGEAPAARRFGGYRPQRLRDAARFAAYSANLLLLTLCATREVFYSDLCAGTDDVVDAWRRQTLLWRSQLPVDPWVGLVSVIRVERGWSEGTRSIRLTWGTAHFDYPPTDLNWTYNLPPDPNREGHGFADSGDAPEAFLYRANFECERVDDVIGHAIEPLARTLGSSMNTFAAGRPDITSSAAHVLLDAWLAPTRRPDPGERREVYERVVRAAANEWPQWNHQERVAFASLVLDLLATDDQVPPVLAAELMKNLINARGIDFALELPNRFVKCLLLFLGRDRETDQLLRAVLEEVLEESLAESADPHLAVEAIIRCHELGLPIFGKGTPAWTQPAVERTLAKRPDLTRRWTALNIETATAPPS
ncbi:hypothetical protein DFJ67_8341 [Asanoa ferruginea]|uniref:NACHT N-terminal Helical domain-containing protein n=1 Tax=Asanoa ferruginea TaxID=53367 RepID=A0A3D9ZYI5_9ACTN|nr:hypothetical protein [Asanoa ferruginea]REG02249.1 hypothetical protein DFJ67_8341 [Asanoa ferruginea]GIF46486.1 hypothetical protein Afe04nite_10250 [Asanoa ferruginea]